MARSDFEWPYMVVNDLYFGRLRGKDVIIPGAEGISFSSWQDEYNGTKFAEYYEGLIGRIKFLETREKAFSSGTITEKIVSCITSTHGSMAALSDLNAVYK